MTQNPAASVLGLPADPVKVHNPFFDATELSKQGEHGKAERIYLELLNSDFDNSAILAALGMCYAVTERSGLAASLLQRSLEKINNIIPDFTRLGITPKSESQAALDQFVQIKRSEVQNALGTCYKQENLTHKARELFIAAQEGIPLNADIQNNMGTLYINEGKPEKALEHMNLAIGIDPQHGQAHWNRSLAWLEMGDYAKGWPEYDWGFAGGVRNKRNFFREELPDWDGSPGKTIVVYGEQGIGDEIMFASCIPDTVRRSKHVVFECHKRLQSLFSQSFGLDTYPTREDPNISWPYLPTGQKRYEFDAKIAIGSLPKFFRNSIEDFPGTPYIYPDEARKQHYAEKLKALGSRPKVGLAWIGGVKRTRVEVRSVHLEQLIPLLRKDVDYISLQYTDCKDEVDRLAKKHGITIHHWPEAVQCHNYAETAALVSNLDLVITVCTSVVHLAGSMGVPTWVLTPSRPAWRYRLDLDYMPVYGKTVTLFRQAPDSTDWKPVIEEVSQALDDLLKP